MSEHTENIRRAVTTGLGKLVDALDTMEKERDAAQEVAEERRRELNRAYEQLKDLRESKKGWVQV